MTVHELTEAMHEFVRSKGFYEKDSIHPQTPKNLAVSLVVEASEVLEHFQWSEDADPAELEGELADVALYLLQLASICGIDLERAVMRKLKINEARKWE